MRDYTAANKEYTNVVVDGGFDFKAWAARQISETEIFDGIKIDNVSCSTPPPARSRFVHMYNMKILRSIPQNWTFKETRELKKWRRPGRRISIIITSAAVFMGLLL